MAVDNAAIDLGILEEDDEFEEFPVENWGKEGENEEDLSVWEDNWEDDVVQDDFSQQLREQLEKLKDVHPSGGLLMIAKPPGPRPMNGVDKFKAVPDQTGGTNQTAAGPNPPNRPDRDTGSNEATEGNQVAGGNQTGTEEAQARQMARLNLAAAPEVAATLDPAVAPDEAATLELAAAPDAAPVPDETAAPDPAAAPDPTAAPDLTAAPDPTAALDQPPKPDQMMDLE